MTSPADHPSDELDALRAIIAAQASQIQDLSRSNRAYEALIDALRVQIVRLKKQKFGASSEKVARNIEQLELALEGLEVARAAIDKSADENEAVAPPQNTSAPRRRGKPVLSEHVLTERRTLDPGSECPDCGGELRLVGEDVSEILDLVAAQLKKIEIARPKKSCRKCEAMVQAPAPIRPVARGMAGPGLLAHILVGKYDDHLPLYRQGEIFTRMGADIPRSTLIDWCGQAVGALKPLVCCIRDHVFAADRLHADDTPHSGSRSQGGDGFGWRQTRSQAGAHLGLCPGRSTLCRR